MESVSDPQIKNLQTDLAQFKAHVNDTLKDLARLLEDIHTEILKKSVRLWEDSNRIDLYRWQQIYHDIQRLRTTLRR